MQGHQQDPADQRRPAAGATRTTTAFPSARSTFTPWCAMPSGRRCRRPRATWSIRIEVIEQFGTDATRFTLAAMAAPGTDIAFNESRTEGYRSVRQQDLECGALHVHERGPRRSRRVAAVRERGCTIRPQDVAGLQRLRRSKTAGFFRASTASPQDVNEALETYRFHEAANGSMISSGASSATGTSN